MRLLRISDIPPKQLTFFEADFVQNSPQNYLEAQKYFFAKFIATSNAIVYELNKLDGIVADEIVINHTKLQKLWWIENGYEELAEPSLLEILSKQISIFNPDVVFVNSSSLYFKDLRKICSKNTYYIKWDGFIKPNLKENVQYNLVLTCLDSIAEKYRKIGANSEVLDFGFDNRVLDFLNTKKEEPLNFVGNLTSVHTERLQFLNSLIEAKLDLKLYLGNYDQGINPFSRTILREILQNKRWKYLPEIFNIQRLNLGGSYGLTMYKTLNKAVSTLNFHGDEVDKACNMRLFEATGLGTCLITDDKPGLDKFFKADEEVLVFKNENDLIDKVKYLQNNPEVAQKIGLAGQKRVFKEHLWSHRVIELLEIINRNI